MHERDGHLFRRTASSNICRNPWTFFRSFAHSHSDNSTSNRPGAALSGSWEEALPEQLRTALYLSFLCAERAPAGSLLQGLSFLRETDNAMEVARTVSSAHRASVEDAATGGTRGRSSSSSIRAAVTVATATAAVCAMLVCVSTSLAPGSGPAVLQGATTFVWNTPSAGGVKNGGYVSQQSLRASSQLSSTQTRPGRIAGARGRLAAARRALHNSEPLGFDISKTLDSSFQRGAKGSSSLIHIDLPIEQFQIGATVGGGKPNMQLQNRDGTVRPEYLRLNKVEAATLKEEREVSPSRRSCVFPDLNF